jgi:hypothetical protein
MIFQPYTQLPAHPYTASLSLWRLTGLISGEAFGLSGVLHLLPMGNEAESCRKDAARPVELGVSFLFASCVSCDMRTVTL